MTVGFIDIIYIIFRIWKSRSLHWDNCISKPKCHNQCWPSFPAEYCNK